MAITTLDQYIAAPKQRLIYVKTTSRTTTAGVPYSVFDVAGFPAAGTLAVGNTTTGIVPTDLTTGYPVIDAFGASSTGYLSAVSFGCTVACRFAIYDTLFSAGAFAFNAAAALSSQPSYASRIPNGNYGGTELWIECVTAFTGQPSFAITYTNQDGVAGRSTGTIATGVTPIANRMIQLPLQAGDTGIQKIESVTATVATVGTFNVHVMRRVWTGRVRQSNDGDSHDMLKTGLPVIFADSALRLITYTDSTASGIPELQLEICNG